MRIGEWIVKKELSLRAFARMLGVSHVTVLRWVHEGRKPSDENMKKIIRLTEWQVTSVDFADYKQYTFKK